MKILKIIPTGLRTMESEKPGWDYERFKDKRTFQSEIFGTIDVVIERFGKGWLNTNTVNKEYHLMSSNSFNWVDQSTNKKVLSNKENEHVKTLIRLHKESLIKGITLDLNAELQND